MNSENTNKTNATRLALLATASFAVAGGIIATRVISDLAAALPLVIFYALLLVNTYFSIRCFTAITPASNRLQQMINTVLVLLYFVLAASLGNAQWFAFFTALLFILAIMKYLHLTRLVGSLPLLHRKILANALGALSSLLALGGILAGWPLLSTAVWCGIFGLANIDMLLIRPLYRLPEEIAKKTA